MSDHSSAEIEFIHGEQAHQQAPLPLVTIAAGFPSPAEDFVETGLDLNTHLIRNPAATFFARVRGTSMIDAGIHEGDLLIIDRSLPWRHKSVAVCNLNGEFTVKFLVERDGQWFLQGANPDMPVIAVHEGDELSVWGVVTCVIHRV